MFQTPRTSGLLAASLLLTGATASAQNIVELAESTNRFNILIAALEATGLDQAVADDNATLTVFAPTDFAFTQMLGQAGVNNLLLPQNLPILEQILLYHVTPGAVVAADVLASTQIETLLDQRIDVMVGNGMVSLDESMLQFADIFADNGVVHVIDGVLMPNLDNIVETANEVGGFGTLLAALDETGLDGTLEQPGPFTVFAPNDGAFGNLSPGLVDRLLLDVNLPILSDILQYHVVPGRIYSDQLTAGPVTTLGGLDVIVSFQGNDIFINDSKVILANVETINGNIHVIDEVLLP